jgi:hypothetical protein
MEKRPWLRSRPPTKPPPPDAFTIIHDETYDERFERRKREAKEKEAWKKWQEKKHSMPSYKSYKEKKRARRAVQEEIDKYSAMTDDELLKNADSTDRWMARENNMDLVEYIKACKIKRIHYKITPLSPGHPFYKKWADSL